MRRSVLVEVEGYDPGLSAGEEPELCRRLRARGYRIVHIDAPMTRHDLNMTRFSQYWRRAMRAGYAYAEVSNRFRRECGPDVVAGKQKESAQRMLLDRLARSESYLVGLQESLDPALVRAADRPACSFSLEGALSSAGPKEFAPALRHPFSVATDTHTGWTAQVFP